MREFFFLSFFGNKNSPGPLQFPVNIQIVSSGHDKSSNHDHVFAMHDAIPANMSPHNKDGLCRGELRLL